MISNSLNYAYRILGNNSSLYEFSYSDLNIIEDYEYITSIYQKFSVTEKLLFRILYSPFVYRHFPWLYKGSWSNHLLRDIKSSSKDYCFIIDPSWLEYLPEVNVPSTLRKRYPSCKLVLFFNDIVSRYYTYQGKGFDMAAIKKSFDLILSFDQGDCKTFDLEYYPLVFSKFNHKIKNMPQSDVYFLGKAKNRLKDILETYDFLKKSELKLDFHIAGVEKEDRQYEDEIDYEPHMDYYDNLQHIAHTRCILEIMQQGGVGFTQRAFEAIGMKKKLLTNNPYVEKADFFDKRYVCQFNEASNINKDFVESIKNTNEDVIYNNADSISPICLIKYLDTRLKK